MLKKTLPLALCLSIVGAYGASASDDANELHQRAKFQESRASLAYAELDAIKKHPLYETILKDLIAKQVAQDHDDVLSTKVQGLTSVPRDVLFMILAKSGNLHAVREVCSTLKEKVDVIKPIYGLTCLHEPKADGFVGGDTPPAYNFNYVDSPALIAAQQAIRSIYLNEIQVARDEMVRQANELRMRQAHQARLDAAHKTRIQKEVAENELRVRKEAEEKEKNERIAERKAKEAHLNRLAAEERARQEADRKYRAESAEKARVQAEKEKLAKEELLRQQQAAQARILAEQQRLAQEEQARVQAEQARQEQLRREQREAEYRAYHEEQRVREAERRRQQEQEEINAPKVQRSYARQ